MPCVRHIQSTARSTDYVTRKTLEALTHISLEPLPLQPITVINSLVLLLTDKVLHGAEGFLADSGFTQRESTLVTEVLCNILYHWSYGVIPRILDEANDA